MRNRQLIKEFSELEQLFTLGQKRCYQARKQLESANSPAPSGGKKKGLSNEVKSGLVVNLRSKLLKKKAQ